MAIEKGNQEGLADEPGIYRVYDKHERVEIQTHTLEEAQAEIEFLEKVYELSKGRFEIRKVVE